MKNTRILEFNEFILESNSMKFVEASVDDGAIEVIVDEEQVVGKQFFGLLDKKKKVRTTYRKSRGYEWHNIATGKAVWDINKRKKLNAWSEDAKAQLKKIEDEKKEKNKTTKEKEKEKEKKGGKGK